jgi:preprotein translocase subunit SecB
MAETGNGGATSQQPQQPQQPQVKMQVLAQYVRDMSFENALAQRGGQAAGIQPEIKVQVALDARKRETENQYEVINKFSVSSTNKADSKPVFLMELEYAGVFQIEGVPNEQLHPFLLIECPRMLFPYVRRIVSDVTRDGGFMPLQLDNVDFLALYRQEVARQAALKKQEGAAAPQGGDGQTQA